jgi:hypothetical protein
MELPRTPARNPSDGASVPWSDMAYLLFSQGRSSRHFSRRANGTGPDAPPGLREGRRK